MFSVIKVLKEKIHQTSFLTGKLFRLSIHFIGVSKCLPYPHNQTNSLFLKIHQFLNWKLMVQTFKNTSWLQKIKMFIFRLTQLKLEIISLCWDFIIFQSSISKPTKPLLTQIKAVSEDLNNEFANPPQDLNLSKMKTSTSKMMAPTMIATETPDF